MKAHELRLPNFARLVFGLRDALLAPPLSKQMPSYQAERASLLRQLRAHEAETMRLRKAVAQKLIQFTSVAPQFQDWVRYSDAHYFKNIAALYIRHRFDDEAERVEVMAKGGMRETVVTDDGKGNIVSETTTKGNTPLSNAFEFQL